MSSYVEITFRQENQIGELDTEITLRTAVDSLGNPAFVQQEVYDAADSNMAKLSKMIVAKYGNQRLVQ